MIVVAAVVPIAAIAFALGSGNAFRQIGKGQFSVEFDDDLPRRTGASEAEATSPRQQEQEIRQLLEAKAYRQTARGEAAVDVESELERLLEEARSAPAGDDPELREEVRQLVIARNARRLRQGKQPLDVDAEVESQLERLEGL
jgi:hypothetical protein